MYCDENILGAEGKHWHFSSGVWLSCALKLILMRYRRVCEGNTLSGVVSTLDRYRQLQICQNKKFSSSPACCRLAAGSSSIERPNFEMTLLKLRCLYGCKMFWFLAPRKKLIELLSTEWWVLKVESEILRSSCKLWAWTPLVISHLGSDRCFLVYSLMRWFFYCFLL